MNWLTNFVKPKLSALVNKRNVPDNLWRNCPNCGNMLHHKDFECWHLIANILGTPLFLQ